MIGSQQPDTIIYNDRGLGFLASATKFNMAKKQQLVPSDGMLTRHRSNYEVIDDIVVEILSRLPVKSLKRFRCVCKSWCDLISDSFFVMKHANYATKATSSLKVLVSIEPFQSIDCEALLKHEDEDGHVASSQPKLDLSKCCPDMLRSCHLYIVGSCNGLICLHGVDWYRDYSDILLWNPCTGDTKVLPEHTFFRAHYGKYRHPMFYGFGYDSSTDDYKVILGDSYVREGYDDDGIEYCHTKVALFTLKTGSWRNYYEERRVNHIKKKQFH